MKYLFLPFANLRRRKLRTIFTILSIAIAFVLASASRSMAVVWVKAAA